MASPAFTTRDVEKAVAGATKAGFTVARIDIDRRTGTISLFTTGEATPVNEVDEIAQWLADDQRRSQRVAPRPGRKR